MAVQAKQIIAVKETTVPQLADMVIATFSDLVDQLNRDPLDLAAIANITEDIKTLTDKLATQVAALAGTKTSLAATQVALTALQTTVNTLSSSVASKLDKVNTNFLGLITNTGTGISNFPSSGDWGFQNNAGTLTLRFNVSGTVKASAALT